MLDASTNNCPVRSSDTRCLNCFKLGIRYGPGPSSKAPLFPPKSAWPSSRADNSCRRCDRSYTSRHGYCSDRNRVPCRVIRAWTLGWKFCCGSRRLGCSRPNRWRADNILLWTTVEWTVMRCAAPRFAERQGHGMTKEHRTPTCPRHWPPYDLLQTVRKSRR